MKRALLDLLVCPTCKSVLVLHTVTSEREILNNSLDCKKCHKKYPIIEGVPSFVSAEKAAVGQTQSAFGFEWMRSKDFGFKKSASLYKNEEAVFFGKTMLKKQEVKNAVILDAGCGNGRYLMQAGKYGKSVIGIDFSEAAFIAYKNVKSRPNCHVVQADITHLPFRENTFDVVYSIGVLHHTKNTEKSFASLAKALKRNGILSITLYRKGNVIYEFVDRSLRSVTTSMDREALWKLCHRTSPFMKVVTLNDNRIMRDVLSRFVNVSSHPLVLFDWYMPKIARHFLPSDAEKWYKKCGFVKVECTEKPRWYYKFVPSTAFGMRGMKQ